MKKSIFIMIIVIANVVNAQNDPQFSSYENVLPFYNPSSTAANDNIRFMSTYKYAWTGVEGNPNSFVTYISNSIASKNKNIAMLNGAKSGRRRMFQKQGIGAYVVKDNLSIFSNTQIGVSYSQYYGLSKELSLAFGLNVGLYNTIINKDDILLRDIDDVLINSLDERNLLFLDASFGCMLIHKNFFISYSLNHFMQGVSLNDNENFNNYLYMHHYIIGGAYIKILDDYSLIPQLMIKKAGIQSLNFYLGLKFDFLEKFRIGFAYRYKESLIFSTQFRITKNLNLSYAYDYVLMNMQTLGSHEIVLRFDFYKQGQKKELKYKFL